MDFLDVARVFVASLGRGEYVDMYVQKAKGEYSLRRQTQDHYLSPLSIQTSFNRFIPTIKNILAVISSSSGN